MNDFAMQNDTAKLTYLMFVNCEVRGWVTEKLCMKWAPRPWQGRGGAVRVAFGCVVNLTTELLTFVLSPSEGERRRFARLIAAGAGSRWVCACC